MSKLLNIPFYVGEGRRCAQAALRSLLDFKGIQKDYNELDLLVGSNSENSISMFQIADSLHNLGFRFYYPVRPFFESADFKEIVGIIKDKYGNRISSLFNFQLLRESFEKVRSNGLYAVKEKRPRLDELVESLEQDKAVLFLVSYDKMIGRPTGEIMRNGHYMVLTGIDKNFVYAHDSGPQGAMLNRPILKNKFLESWNFSFFDWDVIIV